ncbi:hypothetical protein H8D30_06265 [bacterium]|nr:hypothetical protein [bacterium]
MKRLSFPLALIFLSCGGGGGGGTPANPIQYNLSSSQIIMDGVNGVDAVPFSLAGIAHLLICDATSGELHHYLQDPFTAPPGDNTVDNQGCSGLFGVSDEANGIYHALYVRDPGTGKELVHAWWDGSSWALAPVGPVGALGGSPHLLLGGTALHLVFRNGTGAFATPTYAETPLGVGPFVWTTPIDIGTPGAGMGGTPQLVLSGTSLYLFHFDGAAGALRLLSCASSCDLVSNWTPDPSPPLIPDVGAAFSVDVVPSTGNLALLYRDTINSEVRYRAWSTANPFTPGSNIVPVWSVSGLLTPRLHLKIEPGGRRHNLAWIQNGANLELRHRYGFGAFIDDGNDPFYIQPMDPSFTPSLHPLFEAGSNPIMVLSWVTGPSVRWERRTPVF